MPESINTDDWKHSHVFHEGNPLAEKNTLRAVILTVLMMVIEIGGGWAYNSMALLADGWHMSSHAVALGLSTLAYAYARRFSADARFSFGTWKIEVLGSYTSAIFLVLVAGLMLFQSAERLISPSAIHYDQAIAIAAFGLLINLACAWLLKDGHHHDHSHNHKHSHPPHHYHHSSHSHDHHHDDLNLRSAYLHVVADAATSVLAILALVGGKYWNAMWLDPVMGIIGAVLVVIWAYGLLRDSGRILLDAEMNAPIVHNIKQTIANSPIKVEICDLHVWRVGKGKYACILSLATHEKVYATDVKQQLSLHDELVHTTIEINYS